MKRHRSAEASRAPAPPVEKAAPLRAAINLGNPVLARKSPVDGELAGVSVALARELARQTGRDLALLPYDSAGEVVEACRDGAWDVAFLAIDPQRAAEIAFTQPYVEIEGVFIVAEDTPWRSLEEIDRPGVRIAVGRGAAYDLYLSRALKHAELVRAPTSAAALRHFVDHRLEAAAGVRQAAEAFAGSHRGLRLVETPFMTIRQAMAAPASKVEGLAALQRFLDAAIRSGLVARELATPSVPRRPRATPAGRRRDD
jgi:polar amino acid transport system substrate-binding protein